MKIILKIILLVTIFMIKNVYSQPYVYFGTDADTVDGRYYYNVKSLDLRSNTINDFPYYGRNYNYNWDPAQLFLVIAENNEGVFLFNIQDQDTTLLSELPWGFVRRVFYRADKSKLYIFSNSDFGSPDEQLYVFDLTTKQVISALEIPPPIAPYIESFFSADGNMLYFSSQDTSTGLGQVWTYYINSNLVISKQSLLDIGCPNAEHSELMRGRKGKGIIASRTQSIDSFYYRIYDFDNSVGFNFITTSDNVEPFFTNDGKYFIFCQQGRDSIYIGDPPSFEGSYQPYFTGKINIFDVTTSQLLKTINLSPRGEFYYFDNYPNNIYYVKDIGLPTRQIFTLKMDSIFNELNLNSLTPSTATINSPSFTLTAKGRGFDSSSTVYFNGQTRTTTFVSDSLLTAQILSSAISLAGNFPVWVTDKWAVSDTLQFTVTQSSSPNLTVNLKNSQGALLTTGSLQYYEGSWKDAVNNGDGTFTIITNLNSVSLRMTYEYGSQTVANINAHNNTYTFQTVNAAVQLKNSLGNLVDVGTVQYYSGAWRNFGTTTNGVANKELLPINYSFRMAYEFASIDKQQNLSVDPTVVFQTVNATVQLKNSLGNLIDAGTVQYYSGAWRNFGTTTNGVARKELLPINYSFRMAYEFASIDKQQNLLNNPTVVFQTVNAAVQLKNSSGNLIDAGTVQYYSGAWRNFGTTTNGLANKELLPINYSFRMAYEFASIDKQQNLSVDPTVVFQTVNAAVQLKNSLGNFIDAGTVQYYSGAWRNFGTTTNGLANKELLPINYSFRMVYEYVSNDKQQNLSTNPVVYFTTVLCSVKVKNSNNQPLNNANVKYYSGAWRDLGITNATGITTKELLSANLSFRASVGSVSKDKQQDITTNNLVEINLNIP